MVVEVRSITARPVRRRGMKPLVEAVVADATGHDEGDVLQPAVARAQATARDAAAAARASTRARNRFRVNVPRADRRGRRVGPTPWRSYPATEGLTSTQILAARPRAPRRVARRRSSRCPARMRVAERLPDRAGRARRRALRRPRGRPRRLGLRGAAARPGRAAAPARRAPRRRCAPRRWPTPATLTARWLDELLPFTPTGDQRARDGRRSTPTSRASARCSGC